MLSRNYNYLNISLTLVFSKSAWLFNSWIFRRTLLNPLFQTEKVLTTVWLCVKVENPWWWWWWWWWCGSGKVCERIILELFLVLVWARIAYAWCDGQAKTYEIDSNCFIFLERSKSRQSREKNMVWSFLKFHYFSFEYFNSI